MDLFINDFAKITELNIKMVLDRPQIFKQKLNFISDILITDSAMNNKKPEKCKLVKTNCKSIRG